MRQSENPAELTTDDIAKLNGERMGNGCLWVVAVPALLVFLFFLYRFIFFSKWSYDYVTSNVLTLAVIGGIPLLLLIPLYKFIKKKDGQINRDIAGRQKKIIISPITSKRIESSDITRGRQKGGIASEYFMTVSGIEYPMTEHKYLLIPVGEYMEIHEAPNSKIILKERWLKQDEIIEEVNNEIHEEETNEKTNKSILD